MKATVSSKGQMVIPKEVRSRLNLAKGVKLAFSIPGPGVFQAEVLRKIKSGRSYKIKIDRKTGFPFFVASRAPKVTSRQVEAALEQFR